MSGVNISGSECFWKTFSIGLRSRQNSVPVASAMSSSSALGLNRLSDVERGRSLSRLAYEFARARRGQEPVREVADRRGPPVAPRFPQTPLEAGRTGFP